MRFRHILSETRAGLRQNPSMTLAVIKDNVGAVAVWRRIAGESAGQPHEGQWYDKIEISIFLCAKDTRGDLRTRVRTSPRRRRTRSVERWRPIRRLRRAESTETKQDAYAEFQKAYEGSPIQDSLAVEQMQESFRVKLKNPEEYQGVVSSVVTGVRPEGAGSAPAAGSLPELSTCCNGRPLGLRCYCCSPRPYRLATRSDWRPFGAGRLASCAWSAANFYITVPFLLGADIGADQWPSPV